MTPAPDDPAFTAACLPSPQEVTPVQPKSRRAAWVQAGVLLVGGVALALAVYARARRPFDADTLSIPVGTLRSQAAEADLLEQQLRDDHVAPAFVRLHARELAREASRARQTLADKPAAAGLDPLRAQALGLATTLQARLGALALDGAAPRAAGLHFDALADALDALDHRIKPEG